MDRHFDPSAAACDDRQHRNFALVTQMLCYIRAIFAAQKFFGNEQSAEFGFEDDLMSGCRP